MSGCRRPAHLSVQKACPQESGADACQAAGRAQVTFAEVVGMEELNDGRPRKVKNCKARSALHPHSSPLFIV